jgi:ABC-type branched-subunit amino acid transport system ATPase component
MGRRSHGGLNADEQDAMMQKLTSLKKLHAAGIVHAEHTLTVMVGEMVSR